LRLLSAQPDLRVPVISFSLGGAKVDRGPGVAD
jgi:hypothetical protein